ncbi:hypothetical protein Gogos_020691 [Gossypium gossypioides]|uniref:Uncharacterized protein n=1 Tax=Gossypium gossypioides TaxID=34282 RepID=A0A7J9D6V6_GOSGO|nr:hypothetical protein [Gossypium gossypioides]
MFTTTWAHFPTLSSKYFPDGDVFHPEMVEQRLKLSKSILDGKLERVVRDLWTPNNFAWDSDRVRELPITPNGRMDRVIWFHNDHRCYTTKLAYSWLLLKKIGFGPNRLFWRFIWKLWILLKIYSRQMLKSIPLSVVLEGLSEVWWRGGDRHSALKKCLKALAILALGGLDGQLLDNDYERCIDWLEDAMQVLDKKAFEDLIMILWNGWNGRNNAIFRCKDEDARVIWERAKMLGDDFRIHNLTIKPILPLTPSPQK